MAALTKTITNTVTTIGPVIPNVWDTAIWDTDNWNTNDQTLTTVFKNLSSETNTVSAAFTKQANISMAFGTQTEISTMSVIRIDAGLIFQYVRAADKGADNFSIISGASNLFTKVADTTTTWSKVV